MILTESLMSQAGRKSPGGPSAKRKQVKKVAYDKDEVSDEEGRLSAEESTVAGSLVVSPTLSCSAPSIDPDTEDLSDFEHEHQETAFQSLKVVEVEEHKLDGFV